jgi:Fic family protein
MKQFLHWFETETEMDPVLKAGLAHLWFLTVHPFDDGNGRIGRAIADLALARSEQCQQRFYSLSSQIRIERKGYYTLLEATQKGDLDVTSWLLWFIECLGRAFDGADATLGSVIAKGRFWDRMEGQNLNERQNQMVNRLLNGFEGKLTSSKWAKIMKCSQDTAARDIDDLVQRKILVRSPAGGRSTNYWLNQDYQ